MRPGRNRQAGTSRARGSRVLLGAVTTALVLAVPQQAASAASPDPSGVEVDLGEAAWGVDLADGAALVDPAGGSAVLRTTDRPQPQVGTSVVDGTRGLRLGWVCRVSLWSCGRALVELDGSRALNPGAGDFRVSAEVALEPWQTSDGSNVLQKGWNQGGAGQYKLQVDGLAGRPSCVVVGTGETTSYRVKGSSSVADGEWHELACQRVGDELRLLVDGAVEGRTSLPPDLSVDNDSVVRVGAKGLGGYDVDQFYGRLGRVSVDMAG
ncbi:LamG-like jellyroll fold domain-containing protein [Pseudokineococcus basanitobsidens]|uniref:LamG-like jellyroll fold domain-containing protein n=1 Tax=Pseudokineococcus basanitobsidens TaxID=1926649 RepID=A0ABU8RMM3_9ACTN